MEEKNLLKENINEDYLTSQNNKKNLKDTNSIVLGKSGVGRGFVLTKDERLELEEYYRSNDFIVIDPEEDYRFIIRDK